MKGVSVVRYLIVGIVAIVLFIIMLSGGIAQEHLRALNATEIEVTDGDTIKYRGFSYRLVGFDTPETYRFRCPKELQYGLIAKQYLQSKISGAKIVEIDAHKFDKYYRILATLYIDGVDYTQDVLAIGYAVPYDGKTPRRNWCE